MVVSGWLVARSRLLAAMPSVWLCSEKGAGSIDGAGHWLMVDGRLEWLRGKGRDHGTQRRERRRERRKATLARVLTLSAGVSDTRRVGW